MKISLLLGTLAAGVAAVPVVGRSSPPTVDLGYAIYQGFTDVNSSINIFRGIRYAAAPVGDLRFASPASPVTNKTLQEAVANPPVCPQTGASKETPAVYGFTSRLGNEDCLYLNIFAPANASGLPVFFWIHGGGYGLFSATGLDPTEFMTANGNGFISVIIQYRLGAFGFLAGEDVRRDGALNAGLLDMTFALQWVQEHISQFGGDASRVTIAGESAGAGAVMYQAMAYGGEQDVSLFNNIISASPWTPYQYSHNDAPPVEAYNDFVAAAGCEGAQDRLKCLRAQNSTVLQKASQHVSEQGPFGTFAFVPVTDGTFIQDVPSAQLMTQNLNGKRLLTSNMANEGVPLSPPTVKTLAGFRQYINTTFPFFSPADHAALEATYAYPQDQIDTDPAAPLYQTAGDSGPTAVNQSAFATGQQQRLFNVFAEYAFDCPSYWLASSPAFDQAWKYQFSAAPAYHGFDLQALFSGTTLPGSSFKHAFRKMWGNFIIHDSPLITVSDARAGNGSAKVPVGDDGMIDWPEWDQFDQQLLSLNTTGGQRVRVNVTANLQYDVYADPGVVNDFKISDGYAWEGGRGRRCDWWLDHAAKVPY